MVDVSYRIAGPEIAFEAFDGELVVLNLTTGQYFGFNASAGVIWSALMSGVCPGAIVEAGMDENDIATFIGRLEELGLIVADAEILPTVVSDALRAEISANRDAPVVDGYDDLADLIMADPIHDVDVKAGWPHMPAKE